jgi:hypothetical protein
MLERRNRRVGYERKNKQKVRLGAGLREISTRGGVE